MNDSNDIEYLGISEAADYLRVSASTLRRWEKKGFLVPERTPTGIRRYTKQQLDEVLHTPHQPTYEQREVESSPQVAVAVDHEADLHNPQQSAVQLESESHIIAEQTVTLPQNSTLAPTTFQSTAIHTDTSQQLKQEPEVEDHPVEVSNLMQVEEEVHHEYQSQLDSLIKGANSPALNVPASPAAVSQPVVPESTVNPSHATAPRTIPMASQHTQSGPFSLPSSFSSFTPQQESPKLASEEHYHPEHSVQTEAHQPVISHAFHQESSSPFQPVASTFTSSVVKEPKVIPKTINTFHREQARSGGIHPVVLFLVILVVISLISFAFWYFLIYRDTSTLLSPVGA